MCMVMRSGTSFSFNKANEKRFAQLQNSLSKYASVDSLRFRFGNGNDASLLEKNELVFSELVCAILNFTIYFVFAFFIFLLPVHFHLNVRHCVVLVAMLKVGRKNHLHSSVREKKLSPTKKAFFQKTNEKISYNIKKRYPLANETTTFLRLC